MRSCKIHQQSLLVVHSSFFVRADEFGGNDNYLSGTSVVQLRYQLSFQVHLLFFDEHQRL